MMSCLQRAVLMTEWLSHADGVRSIDMLRVWMSVGGCAKMTYGDVCDVPSDYAGHVGADLWAL